MKKHPEKLTVNQQTKTGRHKILTDLKTVIEYSYDVKDAYPNIDDYDPEKKIIKHRLCQRAIH